ncbi:MAG TPA: lysine--tRNA ligase, partial [Planctomycetota bacterium]|nr:lysine--tRNA ligase [Planctomycetota bacterium]
MIFNEELLEKRQKLIDLQINPYPYDFQVSHTITQIRDNVQELMEKPVAIAGRITALRQQGK